VIKSSTSCIADGVRTRKGKNRTQQNIERERRPMTTYLRRMAAASVGTFVATKTRCDAADAATGATADKGNVGEKHEADAQSRLLFLGTGSSTGCPRPLCPMLFPPSSSTPSKGSPSGTANDAVREFYANRCDVSRLASQGDPKTNKNYRNNPSLLLSHIHADSDADNSSSSNNAVWKHVIFDVGKTFREGALRWFPEHRVQSLDAIVLTHEHMDAAGGLDDVRGFQGHTGKEKSDSHAIPVHLSQHCLEDVAGRFTWLFPNHQAPTKEDKENNDNNPTVKRHVASLGVSVFEAFKPFTAAGFEITPLPVWHGADLISYGFSFSLKSKSGEATNIVYLSDISQMVPETLEYIHNELPPTDILIVDALLLHGDSHPVHFTLKQSIETAKQINAKKTFLVGMSCDAFLPHDEMNAKLQREQDIDIQLAYDGQALYF